MDKALVFGTKDCRFESCQGHFSRFANPSCSFNWMSRSFVSRFANPSCSSHRNKVYYCTSAILASQLRNWNRKLQRYNRNILQCCSLGRFKDNKDATPICNQTCVWHNVYIHTKKQQIIWNVTRIHFASFNVMQFVLAFGNQASARTTMNKQASSLNGCLPCISKTNNNKKCSHNVWLSISAGHVLIMLVASWKTRMCVLAIGPFRSRAPCIAKAARCENNKMEGPERTNGQEEN